ncbi:MAG: hypothetical protein DWB42_20815 [Chloroflexi bacterium]|nr:hypothetical protein [Chloroflexota bacterium]MDL1884963.1 hypothetical protein [Anaerolineae bacterium CFX8]
MPEPLVKPARIIAPLVALVGLVLALAAALMAVQRPMLELTPTRTGQPERCLTCHNGIEEISPSHPVEDFGCVSCHGGGALALEKEAAHNGLTVNPSALDAAQQFCGECHAGQIVLVQRSLMATYAGAISLVRRAFGLQPDETALFAVQPVDHLQAFAPDENALPPVHSFAANCLGCHLYAEPREADYYHRGTGCASCHMLAETDGLYRGGDPSIPKDQPGYAARHEFTLAIPYTQCNHCHNRGNYDLRTMTFLERDDLPPPQNTSEREKRLREYYQPVGQFTLCEWELDCVDCHTSLEVMGDAQLYSSRSQAQYVQCSTCHGTLDAPPDEMVIAAEDDPALKRARLNPNVDLEIGMTVIATSRGEAFWHTQKRDGRWTLTGKTTGQQYDIPPVMGAACQQKPDQQASRYCHECHAYDRDSALAAP